MGIGSKFWSEGLLPVTDKNVKNSKNLETIRFTALLVEFSSCMHVAILIDPFSAKLLFDPEYPECCDEVMHFSKTVIAS